MVNVSHKIQAVKNSQFLMLVINYGVKCPVLFCCILVHMVRKYKRRTEKGKFTAADLQDAAKKVKEDKRSIRSVAKEAGICHVTLNRCIKKHRDGIPSLIPRYNTESKQVFSEAPESELQSYIKKAADIYFGLSPKDVRVLAFQCAKKFNIKMPSTWEEKECAGSDWLNEFLKRHPSLSIRVPEPTSLARAKQVSTEKMLRIFSTNWQK